MLTGSTFCQENDVYCYTLLYDIETFLRTIVRWELRGRHPGDWLGVLPAEMKDAVNARFKQEREIVYLDPRRSGWLSYLNLSELKELIIGPLWSIFKKDWPPQDILQSEFKKLIAVRNKIAHFRPSTDRDRRLVKRFSEDLSDWTSHYRKMRNKQETVTFSDPATIDVFEAKNVQKLQKYWNDLLQSGTASHYSTSITFVSHHIALSAAVTAGSINPAELISFTEQHESILSFCRISDLGDKMTCYIPSKVDEDKILSALDAILNIMRKPIDGLSSDEVRIQFEFAQREGVIPWSLDLPPDFRI
jgi:hypothetical protein